jgi:hypothetical protein
MLSTAEIRWFTPGDIPDQVFDWFIDFIGKPTRAPSRTDHYLLLPDDGIGIKIREVMIEHKQRSGGEVERLRGGEGERERVRTGKRWSDGVNSGIVERWEKWSFPLDDDEAVAKMLKTYTESWLGITKKRLMRILEFDDNGNIRHTTFEAVKNIACGWELTELEIEGSPDKWWTMGFEAFGEVGDLDEPLIGVCEHVLKESPIKFNVRNSFSYPEWISQF